MSALIERMLNYSDADVAEGLGRQIALRSGLPATFAGTAAALTRVARPLQLPAVGQIADASGLSRSDALAPATLTSLLRDAAVGRASRCCAPCLPRLPDRRVQRHAGAAFHRGRASRRRAGPGQDGLAEWGERAGRHGHHRRRTAAALRRTRARSRAIRRRSRAGSDGSHPGGVRLPVSRTYPRRVSGELVDWDLATRSGRRLARPGPALPADEAERVVKELRTLAADAEGHVVEYTQLIPAGAAAPVLVVDRPAWIRANVAGSTRHVRAAAGQARGQADREGRRVRPAGESRASRWAACSPTCRARCWASTRSSATTRATMRFPPPGGCC